MYSILKMSLNNSIQDVAPKEKLRQASSLQSKRLELCYGFPERAPHLQICECVWKVFILGASFLTSKSQANANRSNFFGKRILVFKSVIPFAFLQTIILLPEFRINKGLAVQLCLWKGKALLYLFCNWWLEKALSFFLLIFLVHQYAGAPCCFSYLQQISTAVCLDSCSFLSVCLLHGPLCRHNYN